MSNTDLEREAMAMIAVPLAPEETRRTAGYFDWRIIFALMVTSLWLVGGLYYLGNQVGWQQFVSQPIESLGSFLEGAFAPLAFLWLVVGYFLQQQELARNTRAIERQHEQTQRSAEQAEVQAAAIRDSALHTQQQTFMQLYEVVKQSLGAVVGLLYISSQASPDVPVARDEDIMELWREMTHGDPGLFARKFFQLGATEDVDFNDLFYGTEIRRRHTENFRSQFDRILERADACDTDGIIVDAVRGDALGRLYALMLEHEA